MNSIGARLREERKRLEMNQDVLAEKVGITKLTLGKYENDKRMPDAEVLGKLSEAGVDVLYVVSGQRARAITIYERPQDALIAVVDVQHELELLFSADQLKRVLELAYKEQLDRDALKRAIINSFGIANQPLPIKEK